MQEGVGPDLAETACQLSQCPCGSCGAWRLQTLLLCLSALRQSQPGQHLLAAAPCPEQPAKALIITLSTIPPMIICWPITIVSMTLKVNTAMATSTAMLSAKGPPVNNATILSST